MRENTPKRGVLRRTARFLWIGIMYMGTNAWPCAEVFAVLRAEAAASFWEPAPDEPRRTPGGPRHPEGVTSYADLSDQERNLLLELEEQFKRENEK